MSTQAHRMGWRMDELTLRVSSQRVQRNGRDSRFFSCDDYKDHACVSAIRRVQSNKGHVEVISITPFHPLGFFILG